MGIVRRKRPTATLKRQRRPVPHGPVRWLAATAAATVGDATGEKMGGLALLVTDGDDVIVANISGYVPLGLIIKIAMNTNALPVDILERLSALMPELGQSGAIAEAQDQPAGDGGTADKQGTAKPTGNPE